MPNSASSVPAPPQKPAVPTWQAGWYAQAQHIPSPNFGARPSLASNTDSNPSPQVPELLVIHSISLPPGAYGTGCIEQLFLNQLDWSAHPYFETIRDTQVSSHFVINRQGYLVQYVSCDERAWHSGRSTWQGRDECNDWSIGIELEGLEGQTFEEPQYRSLVHLMDAICAHYPIRWVAGHEHIAPARKIDPGPGFDWQKLIQGVKSLDASAYPQAVTDQVRKK